MYGKLTVAATATVQLDPTYNDATGVTKQTTKTVKITNADILTAMGAPKGDSLGVSFDGSSTSAVVLDHTGKSTDDNFSNPLGLNLDPSNGIQTGTSNDSGAFKLSGQNSVELNYDDGSVSFDVFGIATFARSQTLDVNGNVTGLSFSIKSTVTGTFNASGYPGVLSLSLSASGTGRILPVN